MDPRPLGPPRTTLAFLLPPPRPRRSRCGWLLAAGLALLLPAAAQAQRLTMYGLEYNMPTASNQCLAVGNKTGLENANYSIEAWVNPAVYSNYPTIVGNDFQQSYWLGLTPTGHVRYYPTGGLLNFVESVAVVPLGTWTHVATTYNTVSGWAIYLNGQLDNSGAALGIPGTSADSLHIGADHPGGGGLDFFWRGKIDDVRIWSRTLSMADIQDNLYSGPGCRNFQGPRYANLEGYWSSNLTNAIPAIQDLTRAIEYGAPLTDANDAVINGWFNDMFNNHAQFTPVPKDYNTGLEMNGTDDYTSMDDHPDGYGGGLTIEAWIHPYTLANLPAIVGRDFATSFWFGILPNGHLRFYPTGGFGTYLDGTATIPLDQWTHVAATYDPLTGISRTYVNGELDIDSGNITGPILENGRDVYIGADNEPGGAFYRFTGILDEVAVTNGPLSPDQIRYRRFHGTDPLTSSGPTPGNDVIDHNGVVRQSFRAHFGPYRYFEVTGLGGNPLIRTYGSHAKLVVSGAPMFGSLVFPIFDGDDYVMNPPGGTGFTAPDQFTLTTLDVPIAVNTAGTLTDVKVFLALSCTDLSLLQVTIEDPDATMVELVPTGVLDGRSIQTVFDDASLYALTQFGAPGERSNRPANPLSGLDGDGAFGDWTLHLNASGGATFALWAAGVHVEVDPTGVADGVVEELAFANAGAEPVRSLGAVRFALPRSANVELALFDAAGRRVRTLQNGPRDPGEHRVTWSVHGLAPGRYVMALDVTGESRRTLPVTVLR